MSLSFRPQMIVALVGAALLVVVLALSSSDTDATVTEAGDTYAEAMVGMPLYVNPLLAQSDTDVDLTHLVFSGLTRVDERGNIVPDLASGWQISPDSTVYTFTLRPNLLWQDGKPLSSTDINFTLTLLRDPQFPGNHWLAVPWEDVQIVVPGANSIVLRLAAPNSSFLQYTTLGILPQHLWSDVKASNLVSSPLNKQPVGSGAWRYVTGSDVTAPGQQPGSDDTASTPVSSQALSHPGILLEPNPYNEQPQPRIARLWLRFYPTFDAALSALKEGEIHGLGHIPADRVGDLAGVPGVDLHQQTLARSAMLLMNMRYPFFDGAQTRQAIELAINRDKLVQQTLNMQARAADSPVLSQSWAYSPQTKHAQHSPDEAKRLLDAAGWVLDPDSGIRSRNGVSMSVGLVANDEVPSNVLVANEIQSQLRAVGIDVQLAMVGRNTLLDDFLAPGAFHMALVNWEASGADPDTYDYWHSSQLGIATFNFGSWSNPVVDSALEAARLTTDIAVRTARYAEFQRTFKDDVPAIVLYSPLYTYATRSPASGVMLPSTDLLTPANRFNTVSKWYLRSTK